MTESITLKVPLETISPAFINHLDELCNAHRGPHKLKVELIDIQDKLKVSMISTERKVSADSYFTRELDKIGIQYTLN